MSTKAERYFAEQDRLEKDKLLDAPDASSKKIEMVIEEAEPVAVGAPGVRTLEQSEAEHQALMHDPDRAPAWARPAQNDANRPVAEIEIDGSVDVKDFETLEAFQAAMKALDEAHVKAVTELGGAHRRRASQLLAARRHLEVEEAKLADKGTAGRLKEVLAAMAEEKAADSPTLAQAEAEDDALAEQKLRERVAPALAVADAVYADLHLFASQFKSQFEGLKEITRKEWMFGQPTSTGQEVEQSHAIATSIERQVKGALSLFENAMATLRDRRRDLEMIISQGRLRLGFYELNREINQTVHELGMVNPSTVDALNAAAKSITSTLERLKERRASVKGVPQPEVKWVNKEQIVDQALAAEAMNRDGTGPGMRTRAIADWNPLQ